MPTIAATVTNGERAAPDPGDGRHSNDVALIHAAVEHAEDPSWRDGVEFETSKLSPETVSVAVTEGAKLDSIRKLTTGAAV